MNAKNWAKLISAVVVALLIVVLVLQNTETVATQLLFWELPLPRALLLFVVFVIGFVMGMLTLGLWRRRSAIETEE